ncbi:MAG: glycosyltransferase family 39 protein [Oxalobacteraceae bacterium]
MSSRFVCAMHNSAHTAGFNAPVDELSEIGKRPMQPAFSIPLWLVWLTALGFVLLRLGGNGLLDNNEGLYAEISREMLASRDWRMWVIPHLNGLPYMEKPPLLFWLTALSFALFGASEWSARLTPALSGLACVGMLLWFGRAIERPLAGRLAALMFITGLGVAAMSRLLMFDMLLTALLTASLMCAYLYLTAGKQTLLRWAMAWLALAVLAKGFVAIVLYGLVMLSFLLSVHRAGGRFRHALGSLFEPRAVILFFVVAVPWHILASIVEPMFAWFYFVNEHVLRFLGLREPHDYYAGAWWYYLPRMGIYLFPWPFLMLGLFAPPEPKAREQSKVLRRFLLLAWLLPLLFFSVSRAKANYYLVAVMPFAAFHLAVALENRGLDRAAVRAWPGIAIAALGAVLCVVSALRHEDVNSQLHYLHITQRQFLMVLFGGIALLGLAAALIASYSRRVGLLAYLLVPAWAGCRLYILLLAMQPLVSTRELARYLQGEHPRSKVYLYRNFEEQSSLPYYLKKTVPVVDSRSSDLYWGNRLQPNDLLISNERFAQRMGEGGAVAIAVMDRQLADFRAQPYAASFTTEKRIGDTTLFMTATPESESKSAVPAMPR